MTMRKMWSMAAAAALLTGAAFTACSGPPGTAPMGSGCMPPPFSLSTETAKPGASLTVQAKDATCNPTYGDNAQIHIEVLDSSGTKILELQAPMNDAGGFSTDLLLPKRPSPAKQWSLPSPTTSTGAMTPGETTAWAPRPVPEC
ncbi:hypothetical protein NHF46_24545 [Arthrobacter alpinus]|nr:hypothetical protein [Arthrobacter alpinus]